MWTEEDVMLVEVTWLKPHEEIKLKARDKLLDMTKRWGGFTKPVLVDTHTGSLLRWTPQALRSDGTWAIENTSNMHRLPVFR